MDANKSERDSTGISAALLPKLLPRCRDSGGGKPNGVAPAPGEIRGSKGPMPGDCDGVTIGDDPLRRGELRRDGMLDIETPIDDRCDVMAAKPADKRSQNAELAVSRIEQRRFNTSSTKTR